MLSQQVHGFSNRLRLLVLSSVVAFSGLVLFAPAAQATLANNAKAECVYTAHKISILQQFEQMVGRRHQLRPGLPCG